MDQCTTVAIKTYFKNKKESQLLKRLISTGMTGVLLDTKMEGIKFSYKYEQ